MPPSGHESDGDDSSSSSDAGATTWAWEAPKPRRRAPMQQSQSYYELEHAPGHTFEFQRRGVKTNKSFDAALRHSRTVLRPSGKENYQRTVDSTQEARHRRDPAGASDALVFVPPRAAGVSPQRRKWRVPAHQSNRDFPTKQARVRQELEDRLRHLSVTRTNNYVTDDASGAAEQRGSAHGGRGGDDAPAPPQRSLNRAPRGGVPFAALHQPFAPSRASCLDERSVDSSAVSFVDPFHKTAGMGKRFPGHCVRSSGAKQGMGHPPCNPYYDPESFAHGMLPRQTLTVKQTSLKQLHPADSVDASLPNSLPGTARARRAADAAAAATPDVLATMRAPHAAAPTNGGELAHTVRPPDAAAAAAHRATAAAAHPQNFYQPAAGAGRERPPASGAVPAHLLSGRCSNGPVHAWDSTGKMTTKFIWRPGQSVV